MEKWREKITAAIADTGLPHKRISVEAGLGPTFVRDLLVRGQEPSVENLRKLADYLGLRMEDIFSDDDAREIGQRLQALRLKVSDGEDNIAYWVSSLGEPSITVNDWIALEKGYRHPSRSEILALWRRTGVTSDWILLAIPDGLPLRLAKMLEAA